MNLTGNTILITGGASGIGFAMAERFIKRNNKVIVTGRSEEKLAKAKEQYPEIITKASDLSDADQRVDLVDWLVSNYPDINTLVNNAGVQRRINLTKTDSNWDKYQDEIRTNLDAPIHLAMLLIPHFMKTKHAEVINVSSGLGLTPAAWVPIYTATKSGLHFFSRALRLQLKNTNVSVTEILPPMVNTDLGGTGLHNAGTPLDEFADVVFEQLEQGIDEIGYDSSSIALNDDYTPDTVKKNADLWWTGFSKNDPDFSNLV